MRNIYPCSVQMKFFPKYFQSVVSCIHGYVTSGDRGVSVYYFSYIYLSSLWANLSRREMRLVWHNSWVLQLLIPLKNSSKMHMPLGCMGLKKRL